MPKYEVDLRFQGRAFFTVEADDEDEAYDAAAVLLTWEMGGNDWEINDCGITKVFDADE